MKPQLYHPITPLLFVLCTMMPGPLTAAETNAGAAAEVKPFRIHVEDAVLTDLDLKNSKLTKAIAP